jgi:ATP-binding cassette subfamily B protein
MPSEIASAAFRPGTGEQLAKEYKRSAARRPKGRQLGSWRLVAASLREHRGIAAVTLMCMLLAIGAQLFVTWALRHLIDVSLPAGTESALRQGLGLLGLAIVALSGFSALRLQFAEGLGSRIVTTLRQRVFNHVLRLDAEFFLRIPPGEVISRLTADMTVVEMVTGNAAHTALRSILIVVGALTMLALVKPYFALLTMIALVSAMAPLILFASRVRRLSREAQDRFAEAMIPVTEALGAHQTVQAFGREDMVARQFATSSQVALRAGMTRVKAKALTNGMLILITMGGLMALFYAGATATPVNQGSSYGEVVQLMLLAIMAGAAVRDFGNVWGDMQRAAGALDRISELLAAHTQITVPAEPKSPASDGDIRFDNVTFAYPGRDGTPALRDFSLHVRHGERVALVGPSGSGKTTVLRLLLRFFDPLSGSVSIGGTNLRDADPKQLRGMFSLVDQDAALFSWSVRENIAFGDASASEEQIFEAARSAQAVGFIDALPDGFGTPLGVRGSTLSGGQRQRIAIARALVRTAPFLLLDEATSALDSENEKRIQQALMQAMCGRTTLVIAHRLSTVQEADRIVVLNEGHIVEQGDHASLLAANGLYARLARLQFRG